MEPHCAFSDLDVEGLQGMPRVTPGKREEDASVLLLERRSKYFRKHFRTFVHVGPYKKIGTLSTYKIIINNEGTYVLYVATYVRKYLLPSYTCTLHYVYTCTCTSSAKKNYVAILFNLSSTSRVLYNYTDIEGTKI